MVNPSRRPFPGAQTLALLFTILALLIAVLGIRHAAGQVRSTTPRPVPAISRALIVSVDGLRSDLLLRADTPAMHSLMKRGAFTMWARTTSSGVTLPSHTSMLTGVAPGKHGIVWNSDRRLSRPVYPAWPTLFEVSRQAGLSTAMAAGKSKFSTLVKPGTLDWSFVPTLPVTTDEQVTSKATEWIKRFAPQVLFVHLPGVDAAGHAAGWGSADQLAAIAAADRSIAQMLDALAARGVLDSTLVLISADHGGAGTSHGPDDPRSIVIPWIVAGPGICPELDLTTHAKLDIRTEDTFATVCWLLGLPVRKAIDGHAVRQILCR